MGNKITIKHVKTDEQFFLTGHKNFVSALCISSSGDLIASGQINHHGFKVDSFKLDSIVNFQTADIYIN